MQSCIPILKVLREFGRSDLVRGERCRESLTASAMADSATRIRGMLRLSL